MPEVRKCPLLAVVQHDLKVHRAIADKRHVLGPLSDVWCLTVIRGCGVDCCPLGGEAEPLTVDAAVAPYSQTQRTLCNGLMRSV